MASTLNASKDANQEGIPSIRDGHHKSAIDDHDTSSEYPQWIGQKFSTDGAVLPFHGNTIICHLSSDSQLYQQLLTFVEELQRQSFCSWFVLLPPSSWHMTVFEGVCDQVRRKECWPAGLPLDSPLETCTAHIEEKLESFEIDTESAFRMVVRGWKPLEDGIALKVVPQDANEEAKIRGLRNRLADTLEMRLPTHEEYAFHISLGYTLRYLSPDEKEVVLAFLDAQFARLEASFELGAPEFCIFGDMFAFSRRFYLGKV